jgi:predicted helicase
MLQDNLGIIFHRREELAVPYSHFLVTDKIVEHGALSSKTTCYLAPLYKYEDNSKLSNINSDLLSDLTSKYGSKPSEEDIIDYIYAVVHSNNYRGRYADFLKNDFPHIPFTKEYNIFKQLVEIGKKLVNLHLMKKKLDSTVRFEVQGSNSVKFIKYQNNKVYINTKQNFDGISERAWSFYLGGYQVLDKWLKSRKGRELTNGEIEQFIQVVEIINQTLNLMQAIDKIRFL